MDTDITTRMIGTCWGDPESVRTYSGVPRRLFGEFDRLGILSGLANARQLQPQDVLHGALDWRRSVQAVRPRLNALWRYMPQNIERLTQRFRALEAGLPDHNVVFQFGVAGLASADKKMAAHVEIPVATAAQTPYFAESYGFAGHSDRTIAQASAGERMFLDACDLIWTNTPWTAGQIGELGVDGSKIRVWPPPCGTDDPGEIERDWSRCHLLFIGKDWERKGGDLLVEAFRAVRKHRRDARLTVIGCSPHIPEDGVEVLGFLRQDIPDQARAFHRALAQATVFCMPSRWESTGLVYLEAALYGLPVIMARGQGREELFDRAMAIALDDPGPAVLAESITGLTADPERMAGMGRSGRHKVLQGHTFPVVAGKIAGWLEELH